MFELTRVMVLVLTGLIPNLAESQSKGTQRLTPRLMYLLTGLLQHDISFLTKLST